jgi:hypothetical protein
MGEVNPLARLTFEKGGGITWKHLVLKVGVACYFVYALATESYAQVSDPIWVQFIWLTKDGIYGLAVLFMTYVVVNNIRALADAPRKPLRAEGANEIYQQYL